MLDVLQKVIRDPGDWNVVDIEFVPFNKKQQQIKGAFKLRQVNGVCCACIQLTVNGER